MSLVHNVQLGTVKLDARTVSEWGTERLPTLTFYHSLMGGPKGGYLVYATDRLDVAKFGLWCLWQAVVWRQAKPVKGPI